MNELIYIASLVLIHGRHVKSAPHCLDDLASYLTMEGFERSEVYLDPKDVSQHYFSKRDPDYNLITMLVYDAADRLIKEFHFSQVEGEKVG